MSAAHGGTADGLNDALEKRSARKADHGHAALNHQHHGVVFDEKAATPYLDSVKQADAVVASLQQKLGVPPPGRRRSARQLVVARNGAQALAMRSQR